MVAPEPKFGLAELADANKQAIKDAGERYFPNRNPEFPDMRIESFDDSIAGLVGGEEFRALVEGIKKDIKDGWRDFNLAAAPDYRDKLSDPECVLCALNDLANSPPGGGSEAFVKIRQRIQNARRKADTLLNRIRRAREKKFRKNGSYPLGDESIGVISYINALGRAMDFMPGKQWSMVAGKNVHMLANASGLHQSGTLVLSGEWGMGKTHSLCDLTKRHEGRGFPVLLVLAKDLMLSPNSSPGDVLARQTELADNFNGLLRRLDALGRKAGVRALLLVDGVNERNPGNIWERELNKMLKQARRFPFVGFVVSYRFPFRHGLSEIEMLKTPYMWHEGFQEISLDAQMAFLQYYKVPIPMVPPMAEEFTRPLMLKTICENLQELPKKNRRKGFEDIASGQKGMTFILERYVKKRAESVSDGDDCLSPQDVWILVKDEIAPYMADNLTEEMPAIFLLQAMRKRFSVDWREARKTLRNMAREGVVIMGRMDWEPRERGAGSLPKKLRLRATVQMPYQRFGDHIIARYLLRKHLKTKSAGAVRRSFYAHRPLGRIFALERDEHDIRPTSKLVGSGLAEALILEFSERIKKTPGISAESRELLCHLPSWRTKWRAYRSPFIRGLYWRMNSAISNGTIRLAGSYLRAWEKKVINNPEFAPHYDEARLIDALLSLACRHDSPFSASRLYRYVKQMKMPDRDILWGTAARGARMSDWTRNLFAWLSTLEQEHFKGMKTAAAHNYVVLLSLFLGTPDHPLRDRATQLLVAIGERFPAAIFSHALDILDFDDIYYPERMLAACYGVAMALWPDPAAKTFRKEFPKFARAVVRDVFMPGGRLLTHHALVRDYALGIADIARKMGVTFPSDEEARMSPPFSAVSSPFLPATEINEEKFSLARSAFTMDFHEWSTVRNIASDGNLKNISRQIKRHVMDLGFNDDRFGKLDRGIANENNRLEPRYGKVDRYGEKYSWIAYHEMFGWLNSRNDLPERREPRDISGLWDPSVPIPPPEWDQKFRTRLMGEDDLSWVADSPAPDYGHILELDHLGDAHGPWVMLEGLADHKHENGDKGGKRELFSFLRGLLVDKFAIPRLQAALKKRQHPGREIPHHAKIYNIFTGEIPWSHAFVRLLEHTNEEKAFGAIPVGTTAVHNEGNEGRGERFHFSSAWFPAPDICIKLDLSQRGRSVDLVDSQGRRASLYRADLGKLKPDPFAKRPADQFQFLYLRKDLLDKYLHAVGKQLVWIVWGERRLLPIDIYRPKLPPEIETAMSNHRHIHKRLIIYPKHKK